MRKHFSVVKTLTGRDKNTKKEQRLNMMMFSVVILFLISYSIDITVAVLWYNDWGTEKLRDENRSLSVYSSGASRLLFFGTTLPKNTTRILISFNTVLLTLNSSVNIFFYSYFNENFRNILGKILCCKKEKSNQNINLVAMKTKKYEVNDSPLTSRSVL